MKEAVQIRRYFQNKKGRLTEVEEEAFIGITLDPDAIHIMKKSEYSGMFGDYSSFSNELDELADPESGEEE